MKGFLISWNRQKGFGFIKGEDKKSYFIHKSELSNNKDINKLKKGISLNFEYESTDKGMRAINVIPFKKLKKEVIQDNFVISKHDIPKGKIVFSGDVSSGWQSINQSAKDWLEINAKNLGYNCIYHIRHIKGASKGSCAYMATGAIITKNRKRKPLDLSMGRNFSANIKKRNLCCNFLINMLLY